MGLKRRNQLQEFIFNFFINRHLAFGFLNKLSSKHFEARFLHFLFNTEKLMAIGIRLYPLTCLLHIFYSKVDERKHLGANIYQESHSIWPETFINYLLEGTAFFTAANSPLDCFLGHVFGPRRLNRNTQ